MQQQESSHLYTFSTWHASFHTGPPHSPGISPNASELWSRCNAPDPGYCSSTLVMEEVTTTATATVQTDINSSGLPAESGQVRLSFSLIKFILRTPHHYTCCISHWSSHTTLIYVTCTCLSLSPPSLLLLLEDEHHGYHEAAAFTISDTNDAPHAVTFYMTADNGVNALEKSINAWNECKCACTYVCACMGESDNTPTHW